MVAPRSADAAAAAISACAQFGAPVLSRGGGTSLAGQCCNTAVVIDWTKYCHQVVSVDPGGRTAIVQPGAALDQVNDAVRKYGLMVGPKPSTQRPPRKRTSVTLAPPRARSYGVDATSTPCERHGWDIHAV